MTKKVGDVEISIDIDTTQAHRGIELLRKELRNLSD